MKQVKMAGNSYFDGIQDKYKSSNTT
jgi:hypothetical protein